MTTKIPSRPGRILPPHAPGMRIGLFGGTFDPPHQAHLGASLLAMKRLKLDSVWWLVTPGNPLKNTSGLAPLDQRIAAAQALTHHPRIHVTGLESVINKRYTYDTIKWLIARCPRVRFVWIMGADNLRSFHRWQKWRGIAKLVPFVVVDRLGPSLRPRAHPRTGSGLFTPSQSSSLDLLAWPQIAIVVHGAARAASTLGGFWLQRMKEEQGWQESSPLAILVVSPARAGASATYGKERNL